ncbi:ABC transporter permease family protein [Clostridium botulinum]|uniref:hypothetical protein n=1 Tax=Clostridium botulinum TaxID=1491 RepID=UPI001E3050B2|nr:hypothetical protein [Clostridium botulinum]MCC5437465.1 hypothetical protein [Clostridium botulinum]NFR57429.1 hypothetical protein [Clostridium botulinum]
MKLFKYEMKKLLLNKSKLILLVVLFAIYTLFGAFMSMEDGPVPAQETLNEYARLISQNAGTLDSEQLAQSQTIRQAALAEYGKGEGLSERLNRDPVLRFHFEYTALGQRVNEYWNGPDEQDMTDIQGIYPIQKKLKELEAAHDMGSYEYKYYEKRLETELSLGEPIYEQADFWNNYFLMFEAIFLTFLLLMVLTFFISPLFTQEVKTEMDSIVLCSEKGRCEIVTSKLLATALTSATLAAVYIIGFSIGTFIGCGNLNGFDVPARCLDALQGTSLHIGAFEAAAFGAVWLILATVVFGLALAFVSTRTKNQSSAFGLGMVILVAGVMSNNLGGTIRELLWPVMDFNFGSLALFSAIFGGHETYNVLGQPMSYGAVAFVICMALGVTAALLTYWAQKKRSVM